MTDELIDVISKQNQVIDSQMKSVVHKEGLRHRVAAVLLKDKRGRYLIPTASDFKVEVGGLFHSAAGHVPSGESYKRTAARELWEETGLKLTEDDFKLMGTFWMKKDYSTRKEKERFEVFEAIYNPNLGKVKLNEEQVIEQWLNKQGLKQIYLKSPESVSYPLTLSCKLIFGF